MSSSDLVISARGLSKEYQRFRRPAERAVDGLDLVVPEGGVHGFRNESGEGASMLILFAPGAPREKYFEGLAEVGRTGQRPSEDEWAEFMRAHDTYWV